MAIFNRKIQKQSAGLSVSQAQSPPVDNVDTTTRGRRLWKKNKRLLVAIFLILALRTLFVAILLRQHPRELPNTLPWELPAESLQASLLFRDESHNLVELLIHLFSQGFTHVRLINNLSSKPLPMDVIHELEQRGMVTYVESKGRSEHKRTGRWASQHLRWNGADWIMGVDADEFPWATKVGSLQNYVVLQDDEVCSIAGPMRLFGSDGREEQPNSATQGFLSRRDMSAGSTEGVVKHPYKTVGRMSCTLWIAIHHMAKFPKFSELGYASIRGFPNNERPEIDANVEGEENTPDFVVTHYRTQSRSYYLNVKVPRGFAVYHKQGAKVRDASTFARDDVHQIKDEALAVRARQRFPALYGTGDLALQTNSDFTSPWPMKNVMAALDQVSRHQVLAILDASDSAPDTLARATRNAAILDPTWDCVVRVAPGHVKSALESKVTRLCATKMADTLSWSEFVQRTTHQYRNKYKGFVSMDKDARLSLGYDTSNLRLAAIDNTQQRDWKEGTETGTVRLLPHPGIP